ncbi:MAG: hypothetical protein ACM32E_29290 [Gemmatimonadota bacterium]
MPEWPAADRAGLARRWTFAPAAVRRRPAAGVRVLAGWLGQEFSGAPAG